MGKTAIDEVLRLLPTDLLRYAVDERAENGRLRKGMSWLPHSQTFWSSQCSPLTGKKRHSRVPEGLTCLNCRFFNSRINSAR